MAYAEQLILAAVFLTEMLLATSLGNEEDRLQLLNNGGCNCPGESLIYQCTVLGERGGTTVWEGTAFNCTSHEISLLHSTYEPNEGAYGDCGDITGKILRVNTNTVDSDNSTECYISQLIVPNSVDVAEKSIMCLYDDGITPILVGIVTIDVAIAPVVPPGTLYINTADFVSRKLIFNWSSVAPNCPVVHYNILASNCGSCPTTTNLTTVTCTDIPMNTTVCTFAVQTVVCGNITGNATKPISVRINLEEQQTVKVVTGSFQIPSYAIIGVLLLIITMAVVFLLLRFIKRIFTSKHSRQFNEGFQISENIHGEVDGDISTTIKTFDNIEMGNYSFSDNNHLQPNLTSEDEPVTLNNLLHKLKYQIATQWYQFGLKLGVPKDILDQLSSYSGEDRTVEILDYWLRHHLGKPTWQEVAEAKKQADFVIKDNYKEINGSQKIT